MPLSNHTHRRRRAKQLETASRADDAFAAQVAALQVYAERYEQIIQSENFAIELQRTEDLRAQRDMLRLVQASARPSVPKRARVLLLTLPCPRRLEATRLEVTRLEAASIGMVWFGQLYLLLHPAVGTGLAVDLMMLLSLIERARQESIN